MVPEGWSECIVKDVLRRVSKSVNVQPEKMYQEIGIRSHGKGTFDKTPVTGKSLGKKRVFWVEPDCFVVNIVFAWEQAVARTYEYDRGKIASHRFPMYAPRDGKASIDLVTYFFKTRKGKYLLGLASPGGAGRNKTLGQQEFDRLPLCMPPINEQERIARILLTWDRAIETVGKLIYNTERQKKALMLHFFSSEVSKQWQEITLGAFGEFRKGSGISRSDCIDSGIPCIRYGEIYTDHHEVIRSFRSFITPDVAASATKIKKGDLLFAASGETAEEIGKCVAYVDDDEAYAGGDIVIFSPREANSTFLAYQINGPTVVRQKMRFAQGQSVVHISGRNLAKIKLRVPSPSTQENIASTLFDLDCAIQSFREQARLLNLEKSALMQQLLTGKRRVRTDHGVDDIKGVAASG